MHRIKAFFSGFAKVLPNIWFGITTSYRASKVYFSLKCVILMLTTFIPLINIWIWKEILNHITDLAGAREYIAVLLTVYLGLQLLLNLLQKYNDYVNNRYSDAMIFYIEDVMIKKISKIDLSFFDSATMGDKVRHARGNFDIVSGITWQLFDMVSSIIGIISTFVMISAYNIFIGVFTAIVLVPSMVYNNKYMKKRFLMQREQTRDNRKRDYYANVFYDNNIQFEIKLNNIGEYFVNKYKEVWTKLYKINTREDIRHSIVSAFVMLINMSSYILVLLLSIYDMRNGRIKIGDLQYNTNIVDCLRNEISGLMSKTNSIIINNIRLNELREFLDIEPIIEKSGMLTPSVNPKIEFCNVSFRYPNSEEYILKNCSFAMESNEKIGLIGLNGSGKSTLIKLMLRFYDPEDGCVKLDGVDIKNYDIYKVRKVFGVLFQEHVIYCLPLREIIALSDFSERDNDDKLQAACDTSGASGIIKDWEQGFDTVLGRYYEDNGRDLSGGQWQLMGLARAYFKETKYMILDEPSASLDPISEDRIFEQLYHLSQGKGSVTISHRLSNTTLADKILVLEGGRIIEQGSHFELLKQNGKYAYLFGLQASKYQ